MPSNSSDIRLRRPDGQLFCHTYYDAACHWLRATWTGFVLEQDGRQGAEAVLRLLSIQASPYLLNDNSQIAGPWFDSVEWLERVWAPQAQHLGLRYVAHVLRPHAEADALSYLVTQPFADCFELQLFTTLAEATDWLHRCQWQAVPG